MITAEELKAKLYRGPFVTLRLNELNLEIDGTVGEVQVVDGGWALLIRLVTCSPCREVKPCTIS